MTSKRALTAKRKQQVLDDLGQGLTVTAAMNRLGIDRTNFYRWCEDDLSFKQGADDAQLNRLEEIESDLIDTFLNGRTQTTERFDARGNLKYTITRTRVYPSTMLRFLERRHPDYKLPSTDEVNVTINLPQGEIPIKALTTSEKRELLRLAKKCGLRVTSADRVGS